MKEVVDLTGGESVYCINQWQIKQAFDLYEKDPQCGPRIDAHLARLQNELSRNEQAALAFVMIDRLLKS
ncbi:MAG: hypothetical protein GF398_03870 [Chitinivibrionales bacterium]|nr:hypothetical protein [Chitinivibrionales bacterium]